MYSEKKSVIKECPKPVVLWLVSRNSLGNEYSGGCPNITIITLNMYAKTYIIKQHLTIFLFKLIMFSFRYTSGFCIHKKTTIKSYRMGQKIKLRTLVHIFTKYSWILQIYISQRSVATQLRCDGFLVTTLLQILHKMCQ